MRAFFFRIQLDQLIGKPSTNALGKLATRDARINSLVHEDALIVRSCLWVRLQHFGGIIIKSHAMLACSPDRHVESSCLLLLLHWLQVREVTSFGNILAVHDSLSPSRSLYAGCALRASTTY